MYCFNVVVFFFTLSSLICGIYAQDGDEQEQKLVCLNEDPYVLKVPKLLNVSLNGKLEVVHSNIDQANQIRESCNGMTASDLETFQSKISSEIDDVKEVLTENRGNISLEIASMKKDISRINALGDDVLKEIKNAIKDAIKEIQNNVSSEISAIKKEVSGTANIRSIPIIPKSCKDIYKSGSRVTGVHLIQPKSMTHPISVFCDMETEGGGWTVIQKRYNGSQDFDMSWHDYKVGFGEITEEFWIGLENIYQMTRNEKNELLLEFAGFEDGKHYARYVEFGIGPESARYNLRTLKGYSGDGRESLYNLIGAKFSTKDSDRSQEDISSYTGGWWLRYRTHANLNGRYFSPGINDYRALFWGSQRGAYYSLVKTRMLIRPA